MDLLRELIAANPTGVIAAVAAAGALLALYELLAVLD